MFKYVIDLRKSALEPMLENEYSEQFRCENKHKAAYEKAWAQKNFEIELYWKRASYFWTFIAATFAGYFALINSANYKTDDPNDHAEVFFVICMGFVLSVAWLFINKGSKDWQRHWEIHVDLLEDDVTGPLYKTVYPQKTFSVSKINEIVSVNFVFVWFVIGVKFLFDQNLISMNPIGVNWWIVSAIAYSALLVLAMVFGHGRGRFTERRFSMNRRKISYDLASGYSEIQLTESRSDKRLPSFGADTTATPDEPRVGNTVSG